MKNIKLLMATCAMLLILGSCGNSQNQNQKEKEDNKTTTVTTTPDLAFFELQGPVKSCINVTAPNGQSFEHVEYGASGKITSVDGYNPFTLEEPTSEYNEMTSTMEEKCQWNRDDQGQISYFNCEWSGASFTWANGHVSSIIRPHEDMMYKHELEYDAEGHLVKQTVYGGTDEELEADALVLNYMLEYTYLEFDDHGNWTRRMEKWTDYEIDYEEEEEVARVIEYY
jgi:YD repeat-containing protein